MELSIVMPCLNEVQTLPICIKKAQKFLAENEVEGEIVVADNGSTDGSIEIAESLGARVVPVATKGYGAALSEGIYHSRGEFVIMGDSDDSYDFLGLMPFVEKLREGYDLVMGNRFKGGIVKGAMPLMHRYFGNPLLSALGRRIYDHQVCGDFYCGLRGFRKESIENLKIQSRGMEFALEMLIKAELYRLKITEVPTTLSPDGRGRKPHLRTYRDGWRSLRLYLLMSPRWTFGVPALFLMLTGIICFLLTLFTPIPMVVQLGGLIYSSAAIILGYQAFLLAIFAKFIAIETGLHPPLTKFWMLREQGTLEKFVVAGIVVAVMSVMLAAFSAVQAVLFFSNPVGTSPAIPLAFFSGTALTIGGQTVLAGFYFGILQLMTERRQFPRKRRGD